MNSITTDYLGMLLKANHDTAGREKLIFEEIIDECWTRNNADIALMDYFSSRHTHWQEKAREEALDLLGQRYQNYKDISKLKIVWELSTAPLFFHNINFFQKLIPKIL